MLLFNKRRVLFTADDHFWHDSIIEKCRRPYASIDEMNADLKLRWNNVVGKDDVVIHLGDFGMSLPERWASMLRELNGNKILIRGNHDRSAKWYGGGFDVVCRNEIVCVDGLRCWVNHYPHSRPGSTQTKHRRPSAPGGYDIALCGHVHDRWLVQDGVINVGVDVWNFQPADLEQLLPLAKPKA